MKKYDKIFLILTIVLPVVWLVGIRGVTVAYLILALVFLGFSLRRGKK